MKITKEQLKEFAKDAYLAGLHSPGNWGFNSHLFERWFDEAIKYLNNKLKL